MVAYTEADKVLLIIGELANLTAILWLYRFEKKKEDEIPNYLFFPPKW